MSGWLVIESSVDGWVDVFNIENIVEVSAVTGESGVKISIVTPESEQPWEYALKDLREFEKLIMLPAVDSAGWIYIRDGKVKRWRGSLKLLEKVEEGES